MEEVITAVIQQLPQSAAVIVCCWLFLRYLEKQRDDQLEDQQNQRLFLETILKQLAGQKRQDETRIKRHSDSIRNLEHLAETHKKAIERVERRKSQ